MSMFNSIRHLLPNGRAWRLTVDSQLRRYVEGLSGAFDSAKDGVDGTYGQLSPRMTDSLSDWELQFGLTDASLSETQRRARIDAAWKATGGQSPAYIQSVLRDNGFDVYVYEWWVPGSEAPPGVSAAATPRSPLAYLRREYTKVTIGVEAGEANAQAGEPFALAGNTLDPRGRPLVNKILQTRPNYVVPAGDTFAEAGEPTMLAGNYDGFRDEYFNYVVPTNPAYWPYFVYIAGETIDNVAQIPATRRDEFEALCLKICPAHLWVGVIVEYI